LLPNDMGDVAGVEYVLHQVAWGVCPVCNKVRELGVNCSTPSGMYLSGFYSIYLILLGFKFLV